MSEHSDYKGTEGGPKARLVSLVPILFSPPGMGGGRGGGWKLLSRLGRQARRLTWPLPFHVDFLGMTGGLCAVPVPSGSQSPGPGRQNVPERGGAGREHYGAGGGGPQEARQGQPGSWLRGWG